MNRIIYFIIFISCFIFILNINANAQFAIGFKSGVNMSYVRFANEYVHEAMKPIMKLKPGLNGGIVAEYYFVRGLAVQPEFIYTGKGYKYDQTFNDGKKRYDYLQCSVAGKVSSDNRDYRVFSAFIAPYFSYWLSGMRYHMDYKNREEQREKIDFNNPDYTYNRLDAGIIVGVEYKVKQSKHRQLTIELRYEHGLISNNISKVDGLKNRSLSLAFGYRFSRKF